MSLLKELQRRSVIKVAAAYLVVGWLVIQVAATIAPQMGLPEWAPRLVTLFILIGFPIALVVAWVFEVTPAGVQIERTSVGNGPMFAFAALLVVLAIGWFLRSSPGTESTGADVGTARSIAVLPFVNLSGDPDYEYFSDGVSEEILNVLAKIPELRVAARTSSFSFKGEKREIPYIARELQVRMVLEGSVRKQGERIRVTAQLIDASNGFHVWSQNYDRESRDIFAIQDEIAQAIARELKVTLGAAPGAEAENLTGTTDLEAYDAYLRGLALWQTRDPVKLRQAIDSFNLATERDPQFARAWAGIALAHAVLPGYTEVDDAANSVAVRRAAARALAIDPRSAEAVTALANDTLNQARNDKSSTIGAVALARYAVVLNPSYASAHQILGNSLAYQGGMRAAVASLRTAAGLDPRSPAIAGNYAIALLGADMQDEALAECQRVRSFSRLRDLSCGNIELSVALNRGDRRAARASLIGLGDARGRADDRALVERAADALDGKLPARLVATEMVATRIPNRMPEPLLPTVLYPHTIAAVVVALGELDLAADFYLRNFADNTAAASRYWNIPNLDPIRCRPALRRKVAELDIIDQRAAKVCGPGAAAPKSTGVGA